MTSPDHTLDAALVRLESLLGAASAQPWRRCQASEGKCRCGLVWSLPEDAIVAAVCAGGEHCNAKERDHRNGDAIVALRNAADAFVALARAAQERAHEGHNEPCGVMMTVGRACSCGHDDLVAALEGVRKVLPSS